MVTPMDEENVQVHVPDAPSERSVQLTNFYRSRVRPLVEGWVPRGVRLHALRTITDASGLVRLSRSATTWPARHGSVRGTWLRARQAHASNGVVLHLHGGGFVFGSHRSHRVLAHQISRNTEMPVFLPHYRRAPEDPFPAAADDCLTAYRELLDQGIDPGRIRVAGDSAGGHLAACLLADLTRAELPLPAAVALYSPLFDLSCARLEEMDSTVRDPFLAPAATRLSCEAYLGETSPDEPRVNVLDADKTAWPPTLIQVSDSECLRDDAHRMAASLRAEGVPCELQIWPEQIHVFQAWADLPEAREANRYAGHFLRRHGTPEM
ncbi:Acetyl esterase/lipase [Haloechinothrix alba]|uniref:Acetyl esterase/lipase n=1 Tax=Haloechinothrix alba TaxID=664784 RepID=A0A238Y8E4_9PSEU|nr:alpha/beta hydrolase [Haloechinothrix alba]SNR67041.1 Acetyl esterase/lipase [Haloechinothrix alba]